MNTVYAESLSDDCTCKWVNYSDHGGWYLVSRDPYCSRHGDGPHEYQHPEEDEEAESLEEEDDRE